MGKIKVRGFARRSIECDICEYSICFTANDLYEDKAISMVKEDCELFLRRLKENGINLKDVRFQSDSISRGYNDGGLKSFYRSISFMSDADASTSNLILGIIEANQIDATLNERYFYSDAKHLHEELLKEAIEDSRLKAEAIASATGSKVVGIEYLALDNRDIYDEVAEEKMCFDTAVSNMNCLSNEISNPLAEENEEVYIIWNME